MTHGKTYNKSPRRINHKATRRRTNTGTTALERLVEQTTGGFKALLQLANFTLGPDATLNTKIHKNSVRLKLPHKNSNPFTSADQYKLHANNVDPDEMVLPGSSQFAILLLILTEPCICNSGCVQIQRGKSPFKKFRDERVKGKPSEINT